MQYLYELNVNGYSCIFIVDNPRLKYRKQYCEFLFAIIFTKLVFKELDELDYVQNCMRRVFGLNVVVSKDRV